MTDACDFIVGDIEWDIETPSLSMLVTDMSANG
jgi:hypothetical protein